MELRPAFRVNGFIMLLLLLAVAVVGVVLGVSGSGPDGAKALAVIGYLIVVLAVLLLTGLTTVGPNEAKVLQFFGHGVEPAGRPVRRPCRPARGQHRDPLLLMAAREPKKVLLRLDPAVHEAIAKWAADDLRSVNAQIEYALRRALDQAGRTLRTQERSRDDDMGHSGD